MFVEFYTFNKKSNSTKQPTGSGTQLECHLKEPCNILEPILELQTIPEPTGYNYCFLPNFERYYHVRNWEYYRGTWSAALEVDYLSSWKTQILNTEALVAFSSSDYNLEAIDNRIASTSGHDRQATAAPFAGALGNQQVVPSGSFALSVLDNTSVWASGVSTTYFLSYQQMQTFAREIMQPDPWDALVQWFGNPMEGILDCYYLPIDVDVYGDLSTEHAITVGDYAFETTGRTTMATNLAVRAQHATIEIPWRYSDFRRLPPYSELTLFVPYCGAKSIPTEMVSDVEAILVDYAVDITSGNIQAIAYVKQEVLAEFSGNCKVTLPIGRASRMDSIMGAVSNLGGAAVSAAMGNPIGAANGIVGAVNSIASPMSYQVCGGMHGSILGAVLGGEVSRWQQFLLACTGRDVTETPENLRPIAGNALFAVRKLSSLSGYCQTSGASVSGSFTQTERERINTALDSGIYIE